MFLLRMNSLFSVTLLLLAAMMLSADASRRTKNHKGGKHSSGCSTAETHYGRCVPEHGDCGDGLRDATCREQTEQIHCRIPCNWKKNISDCKYKFEPWGSCDADTNTKSRSGSLKRALFNAECQTTVRVSKPCSPKAKKTRGEKESN